MDMCGGGGLSIYLFWRSNQVQACDRSHSECHLISPCVQNYKHLFPSLPGKYERVQLLVL